MFDCTSVEAHLLIAWVCRQPGEGKLACVGKRFSSARFSHLDQIRFNCKIFKHVGFMGPYYFRQVRSSHIANR